MKTVENPSTSVVTQKGQVVIPSKWRKRLGIKNGTRVHFYEDGGELRMFPITAEMIDKNFGVLAHKGKLLKALADEKKKEREL